MQVRKYHYYTLSSALRTEHSEEKIVLPKPSVQCGPHIGTELP